MTATASPLSYMMPRHHLEPSRHLCCVPLLARLRCGNERLARMINKAPGAPRGQPQCRASHAVKSDPNDVYRVQRYLMQNTDSIMAIDFGLHDGSNRAGRLPERQESLAEMQTG